MEIRVHGMGDHQPLSALGSGHLIQVSTRRRGVELYEAPTPPQHPVRLLNWTRSSRARIPLTWYFASPFTLINVAGFMRSNRSWIRFPQAVAVWLWGAFAIVGTFLWATLAVETVIQYFADVSSQPEAGSIAAAVIAASMLAVMWSRTIIRAWRGKTYGLTLNEDDSDSNSPRNWTLFANVVLHSLVLIAITVAVVAVAPATNSNGECVLHAASTPECVIYRHDWVTIFALASLALSAIMVVVSTALNAICNDRTWSDTDADPLTGAAVLLSLGLMVLNLGGAATVRAVTWVMEYLAVQIPGIGPLQDVTSSGGLLRPANDFVYGPEIVVGMASPHIAIGLVGLLIVVAIRLIKRAKRGPSSTAAGKVGKSTGTVKKWAHAVICDGRRTRLTLAVLGLVVLLSAVPIWVVLGWYPGWESAASRSATGEVDGPVSVPAFVSAVSVDVLLGLVIIALLMPSVRRPFAVVGDIAGYWNIKWHPLAALPYRGDVVDVIKSEISHADQPFVLVGHSQGSVLAFTAVKSAEPTPGKPTLGIHLVTCGAPLLSLYSRFFPAYFGPTQRAAVESKVIEWGNFWRDSDPIGCPLFGSRRNQFTHAPNTFDCPDPSYISDQTAPVASQAAEAMPGITATDVDPTDGHSNYWLVPAQRDYIAQIHQQYSGGAPGGPGSGGSPATTSNTGVTTIFTGPNPASTPEASAPVEDTNS
ncbi:hypothetical protein [Nocardia salmonicida]|uniref:hypothetical protein n=1 Tax=Nocardia salmonicida TaxID=53431 RepID=UPI0037B1B588